MLGGLLPRTLNGNQNSFYTQDMFRLFGTHFCGPGGGGATTGGLSSGVSPSSVFDVVFLLEGPAYLISAATVWKWPWIAESVSLLTLAAIFAKFHPWTISQFPIGLSVDYVFIAAANLAFFARLTMSRVEARSA